MAPTRLRTRICSTCRRDRAARTDAGGCRRGAHHRTRAAEGRADHRARAAAGQNQFARDILGRESDQQKVRNWRTPSLFTTTSRRPTASSRSSRRLRPPTCSVARTYFTEQNRVVITILPSSRTVARGARCVSPVQVCRRMRDCWRTDRLWPSERRPRAAGGDDAIPAV